MKQNEWIERYIYAATRYMRKEEKEDVARELQSIINDMLEERIKDGEPDEAVIKEVLNDLGDPRELYEKYSADGKDCLIGAPYYGVYKYVMKTALICVGIGLLIAQMIVCVIQMPELTTMNAVVELMINIIAESLATVFDGIALTFAAVTLGFAVMYHKGIKMDTVLGSLDNLPQVPKKQAAISKVEIIFEMIITLLFYVIFLACPEVIGMYDFDTKVLTPLFQLDYIRNTWFFVVAFGVLGIGRECMKLIDGAYTRRVLTVTALVDVLSAVIAAIWLCNPRIMNPEVREQMSVLFVNSGEFVINIMANFQYFFLGCVCFALILDFAEALWKYSRNK